MTGAFRIGQGERIRFTFDGKPLEGIPGDTLASALLANGIHLTGRSFKYHRPRGILTAGAEEPNALVTIDRGHGRVTPNLRATTIELHEGLIARTQNAWPSIRFDLGAIAGLASPLLSAGFYYKTFMWPATFWKRLYEPAIRAAAGLGRAPSDPDPDRYSHRYAHCDLLVIGAGPTGLAAAKAASTNGQRVILCDEQNAPGGSLLSQPNTRIDGNLAADWIPTSNVTILTRATAFGWYPDQMIGIAERVTDHLADPSPDLPRERLWLVRAAKIVIAAGAIERPMVFPNNDRPGIMLASAAGTYLHRYGVLPGHRAVIATSHDSAWHVGFALAAAGVTIAAILDRRAHIDLALTATAKALGIPIHTGTTITNTHGRGRVTAVDIPTARIACDSVLMSDGWTPSVHLHSQARRPLHFDPATGVYQPNHPGSAGACAGEFDLAACLAAGHQAGGGAPKSFVVEHTPANSANTPPSPPPIHPKAFVDFQNDVTTKDLAIATAEGFRAIEHVKRYTTTGMATDQGKTSNINALTTVAALTGRPIPEIGLTTFRPPYTPVTFGTFSGPARDDLYDPIRRTPIDDRDAVFEHTGGWFRARYFPINTETIAHATARECEAVRSDLGLFDASTLGKIDVAGPDAAEFLDRIYTGTFKTLATGRCKYALLLGEDGFIRDDGVIARLAPDRFHVTTTSGGAASVLHHMEDYLQTEFAELDVHLTGITEQFACIALQGPRSAEALAAFLDDIDLTTMPHMSIREGHFAGTPIRLMRVSFTGEPGYELIIPASYAQSAWELLRTTGATRYGTETMHILRAEKGFFIAGQETDGTVIPADLGLTGMIATGKGDFVGKRSLSRPDMIRTGRPKLVGLLTKDPTIILEEGAQIVLDTPKSIGFVTSAYHSTALNRSIALALVNNGRALIGATAHVPMHGTGIAVTITKPVFYDPTGARMTQPVTITPRARTATLTRAPFARPASAPCPLAEITILPFTAKTLIQTPAENALTLGPTEALSFNPGQNGVDLSDALIGLAIIGPKAAWCLNAFCPLDLDTLSIGAATRTIFGKAPIILWRRAENHFQLEIARSFTPYVWSCLEEARREFRTSATPC